MQPNSSIKRTGIAILVGGGGISALVLALAMRGSVFVKGNVVGLTATNPNTSFILDTRAFQTLSLDTACSSGCARTATGGVTTYDTLLLSSPYNSTAGTRGLRTGTGVVRYLQLDIVTNPSAASIDCSVVAAVNTATGGTALIANASATGTIATYVTPFTLGPTQYIKCGTTGTMAAGFKGVLRAIIGDSDVVN